MSENAKVNTLSRRQFLQWTGMAAGAVALAACAPAAPAGQTGAGEAGGAAAAEGQVTISWWNQYSTPTVQEVAPKIIADFEALHPNIKVDYEITGGAARWRQSQRSHALAHRGR